MNGIGDIVSQGMGSAGSAGASAHLMPMFIASLVVLGLALAICIKAPGLILGALFSRIGIVIALVLGAGFYAGVFNGAMVTTLLVNFTGGFAHLLTGLWHSMAGV